MHKNEKFQFVLCHPVLLLQQQLASHALHIRPHSNKPLTYSPMPAFLSALQLCCQPVSGAITELKG